MAKTQPEKILQKSILHFLQVKKFFVWENKTAATFNPNTGWRRFDGLRGVSDLLGILPRGRFLAIEVKTGKGRLTQAQKEFITEINERGGLAFVARSIEDVERGLAEYLR